MLSRSRSRRYSGFDVSSRKGTVLSRCRSRRCWLLGHRFSSLVGEGGLSISVEGDVGLGVAAREAAEALRTIWTIDKVGALLSDEDFILRVRLVAHLRCWRRGTWGSIRDDSASNLALADDSFFIAPFGAVEAVKSFGVVLVR